MLLNQGARDQRMAVQTFGETGDAHSENDCEVQTLHLVPSIGIGFLPALNIRVARQAATQGERMVDIAGQIGGGQRPIAGESSGKCDLLLSPIQVDDDRVLREHHERTHAGVLH
jgi:hypothetical protein